MPISDCDLARKKPVDWICGSSSAVVALASARGVGIALEERRRHLVHALVGALRRQDRRDEQLVGVREMQLGIGAGMLFGELLENVARRRDVLEGFQWALCRGPRFDIL